MSEPTEREPLTPAEEALSLAMLRLGGEAPNPVYDERGYAIWVASVAADITEPFRTALRAAEDERDLFRTEWESVSEVAHEQQTTIATLRHRLATAESSLRAAEERLLNRENVITKLDREVANYIDAVLAAESSLTRYKTALADARKEIDRWGYGDFHYGDMPRDPRVLAALAAIDAALEESPEDRDQ